MSNANGANAPEIYDIAIVGSGPASYTAAIYAARANLRTLVLQGDLPGGQLMITSDVENYPGYEHGILGPEMMEKFEEQARRFGAAMVARSVVRVDFSEQPFHLWTEEAAYRANAVIVATGASAMWLGLPNERRLQGRGVSGCATCDAFFFKGKDVAVIGGGDTAMEEALFLTRHANHVYLIHRRESFRASKIMQQRAREHPKITIRYNTVVEDVLGEQVVNGVLLRDLKTGQSETLAVQGLFVAIGHRPNTEIFTGILAMDEKGYLLPTRLTMSSVPGVFIAGDVADHRYRQAVTAAGDGCRAAIDAERWLESQGEVDETVVRDPRDYGLLHDVPAGSAQN
jgi:thioredoxin reductase (NADPH)